MDGKGKDTWRSLTNVLAEVILKESWETGNFMYFFICSHDVLMFFRNNGNKLKKKSGGDKMLQIQSTLKIKLFSKIL